MLKAGNPLWGQQPLLTNTNQHFGAAPDTGASWIQPVSAVPVSGVARVSSVLSSALPSPAERHPPGNNSRKEPPPLG